MFTCMGKTRECLNNPQVRKLYGDGNDNFLNATQLGNDVSVYALNNARYTGDSLKATIKPTLAPTVLTWPQ